MLSLTLFDLLEKNLLDHAQRPALIVGDVQVTYAELGKRVETLAAWLHKQGVQRHDRVGIYLPPKTIEEVIATFAIARIGAVSVSITHNWTLRQLHYVVQDCTIQILITDKRRAQLIQSSELIIALDTLLVVGQAPEHQKMVAFETLPIEAKAPNIRPIDIDLAALLYTSGSTGQPKGVMHSHLNFVQSARAVAKFLNNTAQDRVIVLLPINHTYSLVQITTMFLVGGSAVLQPVVMPTEIVKTIRSQHITGMAGVPAIWIQFMNYLKETGDELPSLRYVTNSSGQIPLMTLRLMAELLPQADKYLTYGMTEAPRSTYLPPERFLDKMGSIGKAAPHSEVFVISEKGICGPGEQGELVHRGSLICQGYWNNPQATAQLIRSCEQLKSLIGNEKVAYSGDTVRIDEEGYLWFVERTDAMIKSSDHRISPTEIEDILYEYEPVENVIAFGVNDATLGQVIHIAVSSRTGCCVKSEQLLQFCRKNMPHYMIPTKVHHWQGAMPLNNNGKLDRPYIIKTCLETQNG